MRPVSAPKYSKKVGLYQTNMQREPFIITSHGREQTGPKSVEEYLHLTRRRRRPFLPEKLPGEDWQTIEQAQADLEETGSPS